MKKRRFIAAITALMCAGTVFVPNMAVTAAAETQTSAVRTDYLDSIRSDIEAFMNENHISAQTYIAPISEGKDCLHVLFYADQDEEMKKTEEYLIQNDIPYLNTVIDTTTGRTKGFVILKPNYIDSFKSKVKAFMNENNISGKVYTDGFKESEKIIVDVMSDSDVQTVKNFIETEGKGAFYTDITPLGPDKGIRLCAGEESLMNIQGDVAQFMEENNIRGYTYSGDVITVVCVEKEDIEMIKSFVAEKGYRAERLEYTLPDFEVDPPETAPTELEDIRMALDDFINQQGINGYTKIAPHKSKDMVWVILDPFGDEYQRKINLFMYLYGIDENSVLVTAMTSNAGITNTDSVLYGDANVSGDVDISDAVLIMQTIANPSKYKLTEQGKKNADADGNGITSGDALAIQKKLLGLNDAADIYYTQTIDWYMDDLPSGVYDICMGNGKSAVITNTDELKEYIATVAPQKSIDSYQKKYSDSFFDENVLLINSVNQGAGTDVGYEFSNIDLSDKEFNISLKGTIGYDQPAASVMSLCIAQVTVPKTAYHGQPVNWVKDGNSNNISETEQLWCIFVSSLEWNGLTYHDNDSVDTGNYTKDAYIGKVSDFKGAYKDTVNYRINPDDSVYTTKESKDVLIVVKADAYSPYGAEVAMTSADYAGTS